MPNPKADIHPSPAIVIRADAPMEDCIRLMQRHQVGSLLVVNDTTEQNLVGIFTERDLLKKIEIIDRGGFWEKPIRTMMSHPVRVVQADELHQAAEVMLKHNIRHLPIVVTTEDKKGEKKNRLVGVISMRDIFASLVQGQARANKVSETQTKPRTSPIGVITADPYLIGFLKETLSYIYLIGVQHLSLEDILSGKSKPEVLIFDLDRLQPNEWVKTLKALNKHITVLCSA